MTSTRNKNTRSDYNLERLYSENIYNNKIFLHSSYGKPYKESLPSLGPMPHNISRETQASNSIDIESQLFGIGSTNLVSGCNYVNPDIKNLPLINYFERPDAVIMPVPMIYNNEQRPFPI